MFTKFDDPGYVQSKCVEAGQITSMTPPSVAKQVAVSAAEARMFKSASDIGDTLQQTHTKANCQTSKLQSSLRYSIRQSAHHLIFTLRDAC